MKKFVYYFALLLVVSCNTSQVNSATKSVSDTKKSKSVSNASATATTTVTQKVKYVETSCRKSWVAQNDDKKTIANLKKILTQQGIKVQNISIEGKAAAMVCMACSCKTGRVFVMEIPQIALEKVKILGFVK